MLNADSAVIALRNKGVRILEDYLGFRQELWKTHTGSSYVSFGVSYAMKFKPVIAEDGSICPWCIAWPDSAKLPEDAPDVSLLYSVCAFVVVRKNPKTHALTARIDITARDKFNYCPVIFNRVWRINSDGEVV